MSITADLLRGNTDAIILARLTESDSYGYQINKSIREATNGRYELKEATLYTAFRRLEEAGCICSYWGDGDSGARRRYYSITRHGTEVYNNYVSDWNEACDIISRLVSVNSGGDK
ncbi:MAG: PadR family transcriptional regulator [Eubacteriales bacterium]|nr:PadR family transcriptional regulator [Eubacteriales bacterium]MDY4898612.1 PadR family transcriptional regulator [Eubacteriales bacterium]